jgi:heme-degrading monooxygenase HmoA
MNYQSEQEDDVVTLINPFIVPQEKLEETIIMWEQARDFLQQQTGYISTSLHQSIEPDSRYRLINVAKWKSIEAFKAASTKMRAEANLPRIEGVQGEPALYNLIRQ